MDYGYEGYDLDNFPNDMYFLNGKNKLVIQGEGYFNEDATFPIGVKTDVQGVVSFTIDELENFDKNQKIFIYDKEANKYYNLRKESFEVVLPAGTFENRFYLSFKNKKQNKDDKTTQDKTEITASGDIQVLFTRSNSILSILNTNLDATVNTVFLYNTQGQMIVKWETGNKDQNNIQIELQNIVSGIYITKLDTSKGEITKKIIIP